MKKITLLFAVLCLPMILFAQAPANDDCANRIVIAVTTTGVNDYAFDNTMATESIDASCDNAAQNNLDVWYEFTSPVDGNISITGIGGLDVVSFFDSCGGAELTCFSSSGYLYNATVGTTYVLRMSRRDTFAGAVSFGIRAFEDAANDECVDRTTIAVTTTEILEYTFDFRGATESLDSSCDNATNVNLDVFYEFTAPVNGNIRITGIGGFDNVTFFDSCGGTELTCFTDDGYLYDVTMDATYVLRMARRSVFADEVTFGMQAFEEIDIDECADRATIAVTTTEITVYSVDFRSATESLDSSCDNASNTNLDVFYEFTAPVNGNIRITGISGFDNVTFFDSCGGTELTCFTDDGYLYNVTMSTTYILRMARRSVFADEATFGIQAFDEIANDECADREIIAVTTTEITEYSVDFRRATESLDSSCDTASNNNLDVFYEFTAPVDGNIRISGIGGFDNVSFFENCGGAELTCFTDDGYLYNVIMGTTYILRMARRAVFADAITFGIQAFSAVENDDCNEATGISVGILDYTEVTYELRGATESIDASCDTAANTHLDVWYKFNMPVNGNIELSNIGGFDTVSLFDACDGAELYCDDGNGIIFNLTSGSTYFLRASRRSVFADLVTLRMQAIEAPLPTCTDTVEFIGGAWTPNPPDFTTNAIIRSPYNTDDDGSFQACSLAVDINTSVTIDAGGYIEIAYGIDNNGTINVAHTGSIVQRDDASAAINNGNINVNVTTPDLAERDFMILSSPMSLETRDDVYFSSLMVRNHITGNFVPNSDVATDFPLAENFADDNGDNWEDYTEDINVAEGYLVRPQTASTDSGVFNLNYSEGTLNNGEITFPILFNTTKNDSPNIIGNPYASSISASQFITENAVVDEVFFWEHLTPPSPTLPGYNDANFSMEDISMYNLMGGIAAASDVTGLDTKPDDYISTAQGFGIKANAAGLVTYNNSMRRASNNNTLRRDSQETNKIWLQLSNADYDMHSTTLIGFTDNATASFDAGYDSNRLATVVSLFSELPTGEQLGIQGRESFSEDMEIPLGFSSLIDAQLSYSISIATLEGSELLTNEVFLLDTQTEIVTNLSSEDYVFTAGPGTYTNRFLLIFEDRSLGTSEANLETIRLYPNPATDVLNISNLKQIEITDITIYDLLGRAVINPKISSEGDTIRIDISPLQSATYLVVISTSEGKITKKLSKD